MTVTSPVSVALCTYNGAPYIEEQLRSIFDQTVPPAEIIIADDGSTDGTLEHVKSFIAREELGNTDVRVLPPSLTPLGPARNFERAVRACTQPLAAFSDQDDVWLPDRIEEGLRRLDINPSSTIVVSDTELTEASGVGLGRTLLQSLGVDGPSMHHVSQIELLAMLLRANLFPGMTFLFRHEIVVHALPTPPNWLHDYWLLLVASGLGAVEVVDKPLVRYRQHASNVVGARPFQRRANALSKLRYWWRIDLKDDADIKRWHGLRDRLLDIRMVNEQVLAELLRKQGFEERRYGFSRLRFFRAFQIAALAVRGNYARYSPARSKGIIRDLLAHGAAA